MYILSTYHNIFRTFIDFLAFTTNTAEMFIYKTLAGDAPPPESTITVDSDGLYQLDFTNQ